MPGVRVDGLRLRLGARPVLDGLDLDVEAGEVVGLLGPNGAGKTSTLSVLATLRRPDDGRVEVAGHDVVRAPRRVRHALGFVPQALAVYPTLTAWENAWAFARLLGLARRDARDAATRALALVALDGRAHDVVATFSGGMQRRLNLACGLLHEPAVLLLDEPTVGVDPQSREGIIAAVRAQAARGAAVLWSTHYLEEAERVCDRVVLIDGGRVLASGTPAELAQRATRGLRVEVVTRTPPPAAWLDGVPAAHVVDGGATARGARTVVAVESPAQAMQVAERAAAAGGALLELRLHQPDLHDVFLELTGRALRD